MHLVPSFIRFVAVFTFCLSLGVASSAEAQKAVCKNTANNTLVYKKVKKCNNLGFEIVDADKVGVTVQVVSEEFSKSLTSIGDVSGSSVTCPDGTVVTGGGASIVDNDGLVLKTTIPRTSLNGWSGSVQALNSNATGTLNLYAICATGISIAQDTE